MKTHTCFAAVSFLALIIFAQSCGDDDSSGPLDVSRHLDVSLDLLSEAELGIDGDPTTEIDATTEPETDEIPEPSRYFGNVPLILDPETLEIRFTAQSIAEDSNLVALHFDVFGIPWVEFATGGELPPGWVATMDDVSNLVQEMDLTVYLAVGPLGKRDRPAPNATGGGMADQFDPWDHCQILSELDDETWNWETIQAGYRAYVDYMIDRFEPRFAAISIELNSYFQQCPEAWPEMRGLLNQVYDDQRAKRPNLPIFHTFFIDEFWDAAWADSECYGFSYDCLDAGLAQLGDLQTDLFAISTYPIAAYVNNGRTLPDDWISIFAERTGLPLAITETGYQAMPVTVENPSTLGECLDVLTGSPEDQLWWMQRVLGDAQEHDMPFVIWWGSHDVLPIEIGEDCFCDDDIPWCEFLALMPTPEEQFGFRFFGNIGLRENDGTPRLALENWMALVEAAAP